MRWDLRRLTQLRTHDLVESGVVREVVTERDNDIAVKQQTFALTAVGDIRKLMGTDIQMFGKNLSIAACLI